MATPNYEYALHIDETYVKVIRKAATSDVWKTYLPDVGDSMRGAEMVSVLNRVEEEVAERKTNPE